MFFVLAVHRIPLQEGVTMFEYTVDWAINVSLNVQTLSLSLSLPPHSHFLVRLPRGRRATHKTTAVWLVPSRDNTAWRNWILVWKMVIVQIPLRSTRNYLFPRLLYTSRIFPPFVDGRGRRGKKRKKKGGGVIFMETIEALVVAFNSV